MFLLRLLQNSNDKQKDLQKKYKSFAKDFALFLADIKNTRIKG